MPSRLEIDIQEYTHCMACPVLRLVGSSMLGGGGGGYQTYEQRGGSGLDPGIQCSGVVLNGEATNVQSTRMQRLENHINPVMLVFFG